MASRNENIEETIKVIEKAYKGFLNVYELTGEDIFYNAGLIRITVERYFKDVDRIKRNHPEIKYIDCHKIAGYLSYWICKIKPFYVSNNSFLNTTRKQKGAVVCNEIIAFWVGQGRINAHRKLNDKTKPILSPSDFIRPFIYSLQFRPLNGDMLSFLYYFLDTINDCTNIIQLTNTNITN